MKDISVLIKPASSLCNLRCKYCFYADVSSLRAVRSYGMMSQETMIKILDHLFCDLESGDRITFGFQGGEPMLSGLDFFRAFVTEVKKRGQGIHIGYTLQTNGTLLDDEWCRFFGENRFLIGLSLDAQQKNHNENRVDPTGRGTYKTVAAAKERLEKHGVEFNVLTVLTNSLARHPKQVWSFLTNQKIKYIQFIPCLSRLSGEPDDYTLTPKRFASFYSELFTMWYAELKRGNYISIKLFDDLINLIAFGEKNACGIVGTCTPQLIVESNGNVYPCDFFVLDSYCMGSLCNATLRQIYAHPNMSKFCEEIYMRPKLCESCAYKGLCGGGCKRMRKEVCGTPEAGCCGYQTFLKNNMQNLMEIANRIRQR